MTTKKTENGKTKFYSKNANLTIFFREENRMITFHKHFFETSNKKEIDYLKAKDRVELYDDILIDKKAKLQDKVQALNKELGVEDDTPDLAEEKKKLDERETLLKEKEDDVAKLLADADNIKKQAEDILKQAETKMKEAEAKILAADNPSAPAPSKK